MLAMGNVGGVNIEARVMQILLVEDEKKVADALREGLEAHRYGVTVVSREMIAWDATGKVAKRAPVDLLKVHAVLIRLGTSEQVATFTALRWAKRVPEPVLILMAGLAGLALRQGFGHAV
jgi:DNA-binding response OmpR family regulator